MILSKGRCQYIVYCVEQPSFIDRLNVSGPLWANLNAFIYSEWKKWNEYRGNDLWIDGF